VLAIAVPLHLIARIHFQCNVARYSAIDPAIDASLHHPAAAAPSVFSHPQPHYFSQVAYSTAATTHTAPPTVTGLLHPHGYSAAAPPTYLYAR